MIFPNRINIEKKEMKESEILQLYIKKHETASSYLTKI